MVNSFPRPCHMTFIFFYSSLLGANPKTHFVLIHLNLFTTTPPYSNELRTSKVQLSPKLYVNNDSIKDLHIPFIEELASLPMIGHDLCVYNMQI